MPYLKKFLECWNRFRVTVLSRVCNREDRYAITHPRFSALKSSRNTDMGINFCRTAVTRNLLSKREISSKYLKFPKKIIHHTVLLLLKNATTSQQCLYALEKGSRGHGLRRIWGVVNKGSCPPEVFNDAIQTSIDVLPSKNQALCKHCMHASNNIFKMR